MVLGDLDRDAGGNAGALAGLERQGLSRVEIEPGIAVMGPGRHPRGVAEARDAEIHRAQASCGTGGQGGRVSQSPGKSWGAFATNRSIAAGVNGRGVVGCA